MQKVKVLGVLLFWVTLVSPMLAFVVTSMVGEVNIFGVAGIVRYSWIMWLFVLFGGLSILVGVRLKKLNQKYKKNIIIACICLPLLIIFGSYRFVFNMFTYDVAKIAVVEQTTAIDLPDEIKIATTEFDTYDVSFVKITNNESKLWFENEMKQNSVWQQQMSPDIKGLLPIDVQYEAQSFDYFVFYNVTDHEYNKHPLNAESKSVFIAYDCNLSRLMILDNYVIINV